MNKSEQNQTYCRVPELLFQPAMLGLDQAGIVETMDYVFNKYSSDLQARLAKVCVKFLSKQKSLLQLTRRPS